MYSLKKLSGPFVKLAALNALALISWALLHSSASFGGVLLVWTFVALAGLLDLVWIAVGAYALLRERRAS